MKTRDCEYCGRLFEKHHNAHECCSKVCSLAVHRERQRIRYAADPEYREQRLKYGKKYYRIKRATDPEYFEQQNKRAAGRQKTKLATDPEYRELRNKRMKEWRWAKKAADPEYQKRLSKRESERRKAKMAADPVGFLDKQRQACAEVRRRKRDSDPEGFLESQRTGALKQRAKYHLAMAFAKELGASANIEGGAEQIVQQLLKKTTKSSND